MAMSVTLSSSDLREISRLNRLLLSPLEHASVDAWRAEVTAGLKSLLAADTGGFLLPGVDGPLFHTDDFPQDVIEGSDLQPPPLPDGTDMVDRALELGVGKLEHAYGSDVDVYYRSEYFNEYADQLRKHDTLFTMAAIEGLSDPGIASLQLFHERRGGRSFGAREIAILGLLFPAFRAGAEMCARWDGRRRDLVRVMDTLSEAAILCDMAGRVVHRTPAMGRALESDPEHETIMARIHDAAGALRRAALLGRNGAVPAEVATVEMRTSTARYSIRGCLYGGDAGAPLLLLTLQRRSAKARTSQDLRADYGLTPAEVRVAFLLARGGSNAGIADDLGISPHTARRHTERVLRKLGVRSRAEVAPRVYE
jgi:DNA-binding NarL/FixJ family response regulator